MHKRPAQPTKPENNSPFCGAGALDATVRHQRTVCWFSCGAASAVATKLAISDNAGKSPLIIAYAQIEEEHPDNKRFLSDCEKWFGQTITVVRNDKYNASIYEVFRNKRFISSQKGAPCTTELKRSPRFIIEEEGDLAVFGFTIEEQKRANQFFSRNAYMNGKAPLIEYGLSKGDCLAMIQDAGIDIPAMYKLGYKNNNCIGCIKGGAGYWNKIRVDFPEAFNKMALLEEELGASILKVGDKQYTLKSLPPEMGNSKDEPDIECSFFCHMAKASYGA